MDYNLLLLIAVILLFLIYHKFKKTESLKNINSSESMEFMDETVLRIRCQYKEFNWIEPYLKNSAKESIGSGFFIDNEGHILTNYHVVENALKVFIQIPSHGNKTFDCDILSIYPFRDVALLKIKDYKNNKFFNLGDSDKIIKGNTSFAIGYPLGQNKYKVTSGVISGFQDGDIQMDSPINPGNSGGPLVDENMDVIGINYSGYKDSQNVGYAIPINYVKYILDDMKKKKIIYNPVMGCSFNNTNKSMLKYTEICDSAYLISYVGKKSPMEKQGIKAGDLICSVDGMKIDNYGEIKLKSNNNFFHIFDYLNYKKIGDKLKLQIVNINDKKFNLENKEIILDSSEYYKVKDIYVGYENVDYQIIGGMVIMELSRNHFDVLEKQTNIKKFNRVDHLIDSKLIITKIIKGSALAEDNIFIAPCILKEVNGVEVSNLKELRDALPKYKTNNGHKFISFNTENHKFIILDIKKIQEEEIFLSKRFNYEISNYTKNLFKFYNKSKPEPTKEVIPPPH